MISNNNPGNIRADGTAWKGQTGIGGGFVTFKDMAYGVLAFVINAVNSLKQKGTLGAYISGYAPPTENNTGSYIDFVSRATGINSASVYPISRDSLRTLAIAQFKIENGSDFDKINPNDIETGLTLAGY